MAEEGFAAPWIEFEKLLGTRPLLHGPETEDLMKGWMVVGALLVSKLTFPSPDISVQSQDRTISDGGLKVRIYTPPSYVKGSKPIGFYIHSGGWILGDLESDDSTCRAICKGAGVVLVSIDYRLAPQHKYPAGLDDCVTGFKWAMQNAESLGGVPRKAFISGASAGGGSSFGLALRLVDEGLSNQVVGIVSLVPVTVHPDAVPEELKSKYTSYDEHAEHTINTKSAMFAFFSAYGSAPDDKYVSPLLHPKLSALPKCYINCCGHDTLRDDARLMRDSLEDQGVPVKFDEISGYPHYFWTFPAPCLKQPSEEYINKVIKGVEYILS